MELNSNVHFGPSFDLDEAAIWSKTLDQRISNWVNASQKEVSQPFNLLNGAEAWSKITGGVDNYSEETVSERRAHRLATVFTCINVDACTIGSLPINIVEKVGEDRRAITDHAVYQPLAHEPNNYMSSANMFLTSRIHSNSWGNSLIAIHRDSRGRPMRFEIIMPDDWSVTVVDGFAFYKIRGEMYGASDVLHFRWWSLDGLMGVSPIRQNAMLMGKAFRNERYSTMALGKKPPGILSYEGVLNPTQQAQNQKSWKTDLQNGDTPILSGRWKFDPILMSAEDAAYIETAKLTDQQICGIFKIPPAFIQNYDRMTWANAEQSDLVYAKHTITPIVRVMEQECNMKLFTQKEKKTLSVKFNLNVLLRADSKTRAEFYTAMRNVGGMNGDDIRRNEDMPGYEGGDIFTVQSANISVDQLRAFWESKINAANAKTAPDAPGEDDPTNEDNQNKHYNISVKERVNGHSYAN